MQWITWINMQVIINIVDATNLSRSLSTGSVGAGFIGGMIAVLVFAAVIAGMIVKANREIDTTYALNKA